MTFKPSNLRLKARRFRAPASVLASTGNDASARSPRSDVVLVDSPHASCADERFDFVRAEPRSWRVRHDEPLIVSSAARRTMERDEERLSGIRTLPNPANA